MNAHPNLGMQVTTFENPMGIDGFEFVEFAAPAGQGESMRRYFRDMGFTATMRHKSRPITLFRQGGVNFLLNESEDSFAADFARARFERLRLRDRFQEAGARRARYRARQRRRKSPTSPTRKRSTRPSSRASAAACSISSIATAMISMPITSPSTARNRIRSASA
jgi:4-hydroxyphenylpyruvate dioxygenase-like putative hemolysin